MKYVYLSPLHHAARRTDLSKGTHYLIIVSVRCLVHRASQLSEAYTHSFFHQQKVVKNPLDAAVR